MFLSSKISSKERTSMLFIKCQLKILRKLTTTLYDVETEALCGMDLSYRWQAISLLAISNS